jgi:hypothetical protein
VLPIGRAAPSREPNDLLAAVGLPSVQAVIAFVLGPLGPGRRTIVIDTIVSVGS